MNKIYMFLYRLIENIDGEKYKNIKIISYKKAEYIKLNLLYHII